MKKYNEFKKINEYNTTIIDDTWHISIPHKQFQIKVPIELIDNIIKNLKEKTGKNYRQLWSDKELIEEIFDNYISNKLEKVLGKVNDELLNYDNILIDELSKIFI
ncbi:MAG: hypothetical protein WDA02_04865 [Saccharofermentanales bacterium]